MGKTSIEWTQVTWNPTVGCDQISPGCAKCYAKTLHDKRHRAFLASKNVAPQYAQPFEVLQMIDSRLDVPLRTRKPTTFFVNSVSDLFHKDVPDAFIDRVFAVMALAPQHTFQILTKRAERMRDYLAGPMGVGQNRRGRVIGVAWEMLGHKPLHKYKHENIVGRAWPLPNVWLGVSVENQHFADERIPLLLQTPAAVRFLSCEPLLENIEIRFGRGWQALPAPGPPNPPQFRNRLPGYLHWVIVGGESGAGARPFRVQWARAILQQCKAAGVAVFVKQLGKNVVDRNDAGFDGCTPTSWPDEIEQRDAIEDSPHGYREEWQGADVRVHLRDSHGGDIAEWPADLRVREFPVVGA